MKKRVPFTGKHLIPRKKKLTGFGPGFLKDIYVVGERYLFVVASNERDNNGRQIVEDSFGVKHILSKEGTSYEIGTNVRCTVILISSEPNPQTGNYCMYLDKPRVVGDKSQPIHYVKSPDKWYPEVQGLDKHKCGKPFTCSCCGRHFQANQGVRVDLKEIYFCNSCEKKVYLPQSRGRHAFIISTPMGNKR